MNKAITLLLILAFSVIASILATPPVSSATHEAEDSWTFKKPMPTSRTDFAVAAANGKIYVIGGYSNGSYLNVNEMYDPIADKWTTKTRMPTPRAYFAIAAIGNKIYAIAGSTGTGSSTLANEVYDTKTDTWTTLSPLESDTVRDHLSANVVNGKVYVISGSASDFPRGAPSSVETNVYDPALDVWTKKAPIPQPVFQYASGVVDDKIYIIGGRNFQTSSEILSLTQIYDTTTDTWTTGADMPSPAYWCLSGATTGTFAPKRIYIIGGFSTSGPQATWISVNRVYDPETNMWTIGTLALTPFPRGRGAVTDDTFYAIGNGVNLRYLPIGYEPRPSPHEGDKPEILVVSPANTTYSAVYDPYVTISLTFEANTSLSWVGYSLDGASNVTAMNETLIEIPAESRMLLLYANDTAGNWASPQSVFYEIAFNLGSVQEPFPVVPVVVAAAVVSVVIVSASLLVYLKKRSKGRNL